MKPPSDLAGPERKLWRDAIAALTDLGVWTDADAPALERYVRASGMSRLARERIADRAGGDDPESAWLSKGSMRQTITHPDVELERRSRLDADKLAQQLGLTPVARRRLQLGEVGGELDRFLSDITGGR